jgi:N-acetylmuramoyl-L-alanine amidase
LTLRPRCIPFLCSIFIAVVLGMAFPPESALADQRPTVSQSNASSASQYPIIVRNIRTWSSRDAVRLVLDLSKPPTYEVKDADPERITVQVNNALLGKSSRLRLSGGTIPRAFHVSQSHPRVVTIALARRQLTDYKIFALADPDRLVIDIRHQHDDTRSIGDIATSPAARSSSPAVAAPAIPSPTVTESDGSATGRASRTVKTIVIDPGHGGKDPGTIGRHGTTEKDITLQLGLLLKDLFAKQPDTKVFMTRERDVFVELEDRAKFANSKGADLFISVHVNSHPHKGVRGLEIYHFGEAKDQRALEVAARENGTPLNSTGVGWEYLVADLLTSKKIEKSLELAWTAKQAMVSGLSGRYSTIDHGVKTAPFYVLRFTTMPGILAEIAFMSNPAEEEQLRTSTFLTHLAESIADGIRAYLNPSRLTAR